jgi:hypothetical protein
MEEELFVQDPKSLSGLLTQQSCGDRCGDGSFDQRLAVVGKDEFMAVLTCEPIAIELQFDREPVHGLDGLTEGVDVMGPDG